MSVGYIADQRRLFDVVARRVVGSDHRLPWEELFCDRQFGAPLSPERAGAMAVPLEMVRLGPSASNKQPWRVIRDEDAWHLYLRRSPRYRRQALGSEQKADLQRVDIGIAMCHLELSARELGLRGTWQVQDPGIARPDALTEYVVSWAVDT